MKLITASVAKPFGMSSRLRNIRMRRYLLMAGICAAAGPLAAQEAGPDWSMLENYCIDCHNFSDQAGGVAFDILPRDELAPDAHIWEMAVRKLRTGLMPPAGEPRPERAVLEGFVAGLEDSLDAAQSARPNPGAEGMSRLNRTEYANAVRDLLAFDPAGKLDKLPGEVTPEDSFDNMAEELSVSPTLIEGYIATAMRISREAVGDRSMIPTQIRYEAPRGGQESYVEGLPLGTRGGMLVTHNFPLDAEYEFRVAAGGGGFLGRGGLCDGPGVVLTLNGEALEPPNPRDFRLSVPAGEQTIGVALVDDERCEGVNDFYDVYSVSGSVQNIEIHGPYNATGPGDTASRRAIFSCYPENADLEPGCAREIMSGLATRAYRRPIAENAAEMAPLMQFYGMGREKGDFETGIQYAISRLLIDPRFLYRAEEEPEGLEEGEIYAISDLELASRLSFFLWSSIPDLELIELGAAGRLSEPAVLEAQVRRMLADPRAEALVQNFAGQWLLLRELDNVEPQDAGFNDPLREAFRSETELLFRDLIDEDRSVLHLLDADYTWVNEQLAAHYGIEDVRGAYMRRVSLPEDSPRRGLLGQGSILTATSAANRTSPVVRGKWVVENLLGAPVPVPPPGVETDLSQESAPEGQAVNTLRERLELHRGNPTCKSCHQIMDPVGLALENFDLVGRWRETENGQVIDSTGQLVDGTAIDSSTALRRALLERSETVVLAFAERLLTYALGREVEAYDMPAVRGIVHGAEDHNYRFSSIVLGIVQSRPFQMKIKTAEGA